VNIDPQQITAVMKARASQTYGELLEEIATLTVYAQALEKELSELKASQPSPFGEQETLNT
jgi:hypothetical protein